MIYFVQETGLFRNRVKIGYTEDIKKRISQLQTSSPSKLKLLLVLNGNEQDEYMYHQRFTDYRLHGEWFKFGIKLRMFIVFSQFNIPTNGLDQIVKDKSSNKKYDNFVEIDEASFEAMMHND